MPTHSGERLPCPNAYVQVVHLFLAAPEGVVQRSRFWIGAVLRPYGPAAIPDVVSPLIGHRFVRARVIPRCTARMMAERCAAEYTNLATLPPELQAR